MLRHLHVRNLAVIEEASVEFGPGLNIVTGSTGAGKSLVVDSLALLAGARSSADLLRTGAERLAVTGVFAPAGDAWRSVLRDAGIECEDEDELVVRREVGRSGRGRVFLNDQPTTLRLLSSISDSLLRIHGQREELGLTTPDLQRQWLDLEGGEAGARLLGECAAAFDELRRAQERLDRLTGDDRMRQERIDLLRYQAHEIEAAHLRSGEEDELRARRERLRHAELISESLQVASDSLSEGDPAAGFLIGRATTALRRLEKVEPEATVWLQELDEVRIRIDELGATLSARLGEGEEEPGALDAIEDRLAHLERLLRKYAPTSGEVIELHERITEELGELEGNDELLAQLEQEVVRARTAYATKAAELSGRRKQWAARLARKIERELSDLALGKSRFEIAVEPDTSREDAALTVQVGGSIVTAHGWGVDRVEYRFSPNLGEELRPLSRVASGGELARIYLALQVAAMGSAERESIGLVFDEVDSGIGGSEAAVVGRKLRQLAEGGQILAVTHLPQVASCGHRHLQVVKRQLAAGRTGTEVRALGAQQRVEEVARMLGGEEITELTRSHALELLQQASGLEVQAESAETRSAAAAQGSVTKAKEPKVPSPKERKAAIKVRTP